MVGGNFTSLGGVDAQAIALFDPNTTKVTALPGIQGTVSAVLCDQDTNSVYVGGTFKAANSTNAIAWVGSSGWANLDFAGFNGPVTSITKAPNGHIVFGGSFSGLGNTTTPTRKDAQVVNISKANITADATTTTNGFDDPSSIVCKTNGTDGSGDTWLAADNEAASWSATMSFGYIPTMLRMWNTQEDGRGTKTFRFTALPIDGIMNLTYTDTSGKTAYCDSTCPLTHNSSNQDFHFVNPVGMSAFRIDISDWYGDGAGLDGIELFEDDIYAYADNDFNEPSCAGESFGSTATTSGSWTVTPSGSSEAGYLTAVIDSSNETSTSVIFKPDIKQAGNYSVTIYTPGCLQSSTCSNRGIVNVTGTYASTGTDANEPVSVTLFQTNDYDKYDTIFTGYVDAASSSFRPTVTLSPSSELSDDMQIVASRVRFELLDSTGGLNGMFEFNPNEAVVSTDFSSSAINRAGTDLHGGAVINALVTVGNTIYAAGDFSDDVFENIMAFSNNQTQSLPNDGLNAPVSSMYSYAGILYVGGNFTNTSTNNVDGLSNVASYSASSDQWVALGSGLNGPVNSVVPLLINVTSNTPETTITFNGDFTEISAFDDNEAVAVDGFAIWVPSKKNWLQNLDVTEMSFAGQLSAYANVSGSSPLLAGTLSSQGLSVSGAVSLGGSSSTQSLSKLPLKIESSSQSSSSMSKRDSSSTSDINGVVTGIYYNNGGRNVTVLGGHFSATATNGSTITNVLFVNGSNNDAVTGFVSGVDTNSTVNALAVHTDTLFVGGTITGDVSDSEVKGLVLYDLLNAKFVSTQPPALSGTDVSVNAITVRPSSTEIFVGGDFDSAGSLGCPSVCMFDTSSGQWSRPGSELSGTVAAFLWSSDNTLIAAGNLSVNGNDTAVASYNAKKQTWSASTPLSAVPGPVTAMTTGSSDNSKIWISGKATNGSTYLVNIDGSKQQCVGDVFGTSTTVRGLQVLDVSKSHQSSSFLEDSQVLLITGSIDLPSFGNASAVLFNGTTYEPFVLSTMSDGSAGSMSQLISSKTVTLKGTHKHHSKGIVILVALCAALGVLFLIILIGLIIERVQRKRQGYSAIPAFYTDKNSNLGRVPPEHLFQSLGRNSDPAPHI